MPELKTIAMAYRSEKGSALAPVIAFSLIIVLAIGGYMGLARNMVNFEIHELNDAKAFFAAESGLLIGTRWLRDETNWNQYGAIGYPGAVYTATINGFDVAVTITIDINGDLEIKSLVSGNNLGYTKSLSWTATPAKWDNPGLFINDASQAGGVGGGGLNNEWFDGPMHSNTPISISSVSGGQVSVKFVNGKLTVHNRTEQVLFDDGGHWGHYGTSNLSGNNYDFGIWNHDAQEGQFSKVDLNFFHNGRYSQFWHSRDSLYLPSITGQTRTLPQNASVNNKAILFFDVLNGTGRATYYYYDGAGQQQSLTFNSANEVVRVPNDVCVLGTVKGQTTVVTDPDKTIYPVGDIMYHGYQPDVNDMDTYDNSDNYGLGGLTPLNNDVLALVSGGDITFGLSKHVLSIDGGGVASLSAIAAQPHSLPNMYVTAQLIATGQGHGIRWVSTHVNQYDYNLCALGTRAVDVYEESHNAQGSPGNMTFRFFYDTRFSSGLTAPSVPTFRAASGGKDLFILNTRWREENIP
ncbi:MAG: hypothetical protein JW768_03285 [Chitinispirillaceae bacterium]|nr:hypothetical protein [Chitinispirillaceae bacterium]